MTLALLLTAVTGAWADGVITVTWSSGDTYENDNSKDGVTLSGEKVKYQNSEWKLAYTYDKGTFTTELGNFTKIEITGGYISGFSGEGWSGRTWTGNAAAVPFEGYLTDAHGDKPWNVTFTIEPAPASEPTIDVKWDAATKTGTFEMPAYDVEIAPIYAPVAQWAVVENVQQLPTAIEGIYAESTDAIVTAGTVAKIGETENVQGTLMYAVGKSATEQPALTAFSATLPTAKDITTAGDVYVWYYIKGADTPEGQDPTAENTFNDSEICAEPIKVTVLSNKFDIQFKAANANTIEAGKATVKVGETAAEVKEGKLTGVKMNSKVTITAKEGYKFRKAEGKKKSAYEHSITIAVDPGTTVPTATAPAMTIEFNTGETWADVAARYDWLDTYLTYTVCYKGNNLIGDVHDANGGVSPGETIDPNGSYHWGM